MNQAIHNNQEVKQQGFFKRMATAVAEALLNWLGQLEMGVSPYEFQRFMYHGIPDCAEAASYFFLAEMKQDEEQI